MVLGINYQLPLEYVIIFSALVIGSFPGLSNPPVINMFKISSWNVSKDWRT